MLALQWVHCYRCPWKGAGPVAVASESSAGRQRFTSRLVVTLSCPPLVLVLVAERPPMLRTSAASRQMALALTQGPSGPLMAVC